MPRKQPAKSARTKGEGYEAKRERAITLVQAGATQREAARVVGVREATLSDWLHDPATQERLEEARRSVAEVVQATLEKRAKELTEALVQIALHGDSDAARVAAIKHGLALLGVRDEGESGGGTRVVVVAPGALTIEHREQLKAQARLAKTAGGVDG